MSRRLLTLCALMCLLAAPSIHSQDLPPPNVIVTRAIERTIQDEDFKVKELKYNKTYVEEELDNGGSPKQGKRKESVYEVEDNKERPLKINGQDIARDGKEPSPEEVMITIDEMLGMGRYLYRYDGFSLVNGRETYVIRFEPDDRRRQPTPEKVAAEKSRKLGQTVGRSMKDDIKNDILNNLRGTLYIDRATCAMLKMEAHLHSAPQRGIKVAGVVYLFDVALEQQEYGDHFIPKNIMVVTRYSFALGLPWTTNFKKVSIRYDFYVPKGQDPE